jgi:putative nucleotidyltransferase with HDIG domain
VLVATGDRITEGTRLKLMSYQRSRQLREENENIWIRLLGNLVHVSILLGLAVLFLFNFRRRIFYDNLQMGIILGIFVMISLMAYLSIMIRVGWPIEYLILMPLLAMLLAILFDSRTAFYLTVSACFIVGGIRGNDYAVALACLSAGVLAAYTVRDIKSRTQLFRSIAFSLLGYALAIVALSLERGDSFADISIKLGFAAINAILSPVLTFGIIFLVENLFGVATDLKLLEYDNLNHPLLRALADKAPGTYQHTLTIARLAESAAVAIGANALLAKVGSYFHDIGKVAKAEYFVENQMQMANKHDRIKPEMSVKIIRNHVLDGIELAHEYDLPQRIIDFIPMHHGTTVIKYFFDKARETNPDASEDEFRYPGPRPQSRETAIVMLADAVEATTRSLPNPTPKAIEETVDRAIKRRFSEGQLDQCELTLADLTKIKVAFTKNLIGMSHPRIQYKPEDGERPPEEPAADGKKQKEAPMIPYIDDAFGNVDAEIGYGKPKKEGGLRRDEG